MPVGAAAARQHRKTADPLGSPVQVIAAPVVIRGEPDELVPRDWQPSLTGNVSNLASQAAVVVAIGRAGDRLGWQRCCAFI